MIENFLQYGQWVILILSIMSLYLVSSVKHETRLKTHSHSIVDMRKTPVFIRVLGEKILPLNDSWRFV